jgi:hypothetical protein
MVSVSIFKIAFVGLLFAAGFFPHRKYTLRVFFTIKRVFSKIKLWLAQPAGHEESKEFVVYEKS